MTALSTLVLIERGSDLTSGPHRKQIQRAFGWLRLQRAGTFQLAGEAQPEQVRDHALATLALVELLALGGDTQVRAVAQGWVNALEFARSPGGGWPARAGTAPDSLTTGWAIIALRSARRAGLVVSYRALREGAAFQRSCFDLGSGLVSLTPTEPPRRLVSTSLALAGACLAGRRIEDHPWLTRARAALAQAGPAATLSSDGLDAESAYATSLAAELHGGRFWKEWRADLEATLRAVGTGFELQFTHEPGGPLAVRGWLALQGSAASPTARVIVR